jgi:uncharacterized membrane protein YeaQ/YmgE (transglycosylase-associated protein family)
MSTIVFIVSVLVSGLIVGALGRLALPGPDPMSIPQTIAIGIVGSFLAGMLTWALFGRSGAGILLAVLVTTGLVYLVRRARGDRSPVVHNRRRF